MAWMPKEVNNFIEGFVPSPLAVDAETVAAMKQKISEIEQKHAKVLKKLRNARAVLDAVCPHNNKVVNSEYVDGTYDNRAYTDYTVVCMDCGNKLFNHTVRHDYF